jgi:hypothetical protein
VDPYAGFEPQVGEIRAVRTFRIGPGGWLYPLFGSDAWRDGANQARCRLAGVGRPVHEPPEPDCTCGFYAYGDETWAAEYPHARHVVAVVSCWGRVIAGTRGLRCQHARIEAVWMSTAVPADLRAAVAGNYPSTQVMDDRADLLAAYPPTRLDCYDTPTPATPTPAWRRYLVGAAVVAGVLPTRWLSVLPAWRLLLAALFAGLLVAAFVLSRRPASDIAAHRRSLFYMALGLWTVTPMTGVTGLALFRLPLLQIAGLSVVQRVSLARSAGRFPAQID